MTWLRHSDAGFRAAFIAVLGLGVWARCAGYFDGSIGLWLDETHWGKRAVEGTFHAVARPEGFMWATHVLVQETVSEERLRALSLFGGLVSLPLMYRLVLEVTRQRGAALAALFLLSVHGVAVSMAKEFKPYSLELMLHLCLALLGMRAYRSERPWALVAGCLLTPVCFWFGWSAVFAFPAFYVLAGLGAVRRRSLGQAALAVVSSVIALLVTYEIYRDRIADTASRVKFWAQKYGVFTLTESSHSEAVWYLKELAEMLVLPTFLKYDPDAIWLPRLLTPLTLLLVGFGLVGLVRRRAWGSGILLLGPLVVMVIISAKGHWPFGAFRTNTFTLAYSIPLVCLGGLLVGQRLHGLAPPHLRRWSTAALVALVLGLGAVFLPWEPDRFAVKESSDMAFSASIVPAMDIIMEEERKAGRLDAEGLAKTQVYMDDHACAIFRFYRGFHSKTKDRMDSFARRRLKLHCKGRLTRNVARAVRGTEPFWVITSKLSTVHELRRGTLTRCDLTVDKMLPFENLVAHCVPEHPPKPKANEEERE